MDTVTSTDTGWRQHVPHVLISIAMLAMKLAPIAPLPPPVWFVTLGGAAIWLARTGEVRSARVHGVYDLAGTAALTLAMPMPGMPAPGGQPAVATACWLTGKLALAIRYPRRDPGDAAMTAAMCLMAW